MGMTRFGINTSMMLPGPTLLSNRKSFFSISPKFEYTGIDWDRDTVFPSSLYSAGASITWMQPINERWTGMITASPQWSSDGKESRYSVNCPTIFGLTWTPNSRWKVMMGAAYLGRGDIPFIPFGGVTWTPNEDWRVELMAPQARILRRLTAYSNDDKQHWIFGAVGFGGGSWAIRSVDDRADLAEYREFSALFGYEFIRKNTNLKIEAGYVFGREMKFDKNTQAKYKPDDAFVLRMQYSF